MRPTFSIVTPVYNTPPDLLRETIASVRQQTFSDWELILVDDHSPHESVREVLRAAARDDDRIVVIERSTNGHIVRASNDGLSAARGDFVVLLDHDDLLTPDALEKNRQAIARTPDADVLYSDENRLMPDGSYQYLFNKPDWSPWRLRSQNYLGHLTVIRTDLVREIGGFREGFEGSQDHDLVLRATERARRVVHIPEVLYHWRVIPGSVADRMDAKPYATFAAMRAVREHLERVGIGGEVAVVRPGLYAVSATMPEPSVSLLVRIPAATAAAAAADTVIHAMRHAHREIGEVVVVHPEGMDRRAFERPIERQRVKLPASTEFVAFGGQSDTDHAASKRAMTIASGEFVVILQAGVRPANHRWLTALLTPLADDGVVITSGLVSVDGRGVANAGLGVHRGRWRYPLRGFDARTEGPFGALRLSREVDAVDGTCLAIRRADVPALIDGMGARPATDLGLALSAAASGRSIVWTGQSHHRADDYPGANLGVSRVPAGEATRFPVVEVHEDWISAGDTFMRRRAPSLLPAWRRFKRTRRRVKRRAQKVKQRLRPTPSGRLGSTR